MQFVDLIMMTLGPLKHEHSHNAEAGWLVITNMQCGTSRDERGTNENVRRDREAVVWVA